MSKHFHLNDLIQRANSGGKVRGTTIKIENTMLGGKALTQASPLVEHPMYAYLEKYVKANPSKPIAPPVASTPAPHPPVQHVKKAVPVRPTGKAPPRHR